MAINAVLAIAHRDLMKLLRDPVRLASTFVLPFLMVGVFGGIMQANLGEGAGFDFIVFIFTGVLAQTLFMSVSGGIISLIEDRENDFSQAMFVAPVSRHVIIFGKIVGETLVAMPQGLVILVFGLIIGISISARQLFALAGVAILVCFFGGAFGVLVLSNLNSRRAATEVFTYIMMPQWFLAGVFTPMRQLPWYLDILARITPMRYAVDLVRGTFYDGLQDFPQVVLASPAVNLAVMGVMFFSFLILGTWMFVRKERNR